MGPGDRLVVVGKYHERLQGSRQFVVWEYPWMVSAFLTRWAGNQNCLGRVRPGTYLRISGMEQCVEYPEASIGPSP